MNQSPKEEGPPRPTRNSDTRIPGPEESPKRNPEGEWVPEDDRVIGKAFRWSLAIIALIVAAVLLALYVFREPQTSQAVREDIPTVVPSIVDSKAQVPAVKFTDITRQAGIDFVHNNGAGGEKLLPETMGGGAAFFDYNNDGYPDLLLVNAQDWPHASQRRRSTMALYQNDGSGRFQDVSAQAGLEQSFFGVGVAAADYDNDGWIDIFMTALGTNHLYRNEEGTFREVTATTGVEGADEDWSSSAGFFDADQDGDLDLFVCNYVRWSRQIDLDLNFTLNGRDRAYGPPTSFTGTYSNFYRNNGDGTFSDISAQAGIHVDNPATGNPMGKALALQPIDLDRDGWMDVLVANDTVQNFLFHNLGNGTFEEFGAFSGLGFDSHGNATGAMGIDSAHFRNSQALGVGISNFANEMTSLMVSDEESLQFNDEAASEGIGSASRLKLSFGLFFFDYDLDGRLDLFQANGHLDEEINEVQASQHYEQTAQLFWNQGSGSLSTFEEVPSESLGDFSRPLVGRGATYADIDSDGDLDILITQTGRSPVLLRNDQDLAHSWLRILLDSGGPNGNGIGAWIELEAGGETQRRQVMPTKSYLSQVELAVTFGLGENTQIDALRIEWPDGTLQEVKPLPLLNQTVKVEKTP